MKKRIIVFGATGKTGAQIIKHLKSNNLEFFAFVREQSANKLDGESIPMIKGNVLEPEDVLSAFKDHTFTDIIISLGNQSLKYTGIRVNGTENIIKAMEAIHGDASFHIVSALGVGESASQLKWYNKLFANILLKNVMLDHERQEAIVKGSKFRYHIIRPVGLKDGSSDGKIHVQSEGYLPKGSIKRGDVAKYLVDGILKNKVGISNICQG